MASLTEAFIVGQEQYRKLGCPATIPFEVITPHEPFALGRYGKTLAQLQGQLSPLELYALLQESSTPSMTEEAASKNLNQLIHLRQSAKATMLFITLGGLVDLCIKH